MENEAENNIAESATPLESEQTLDVEAAEDNKPAEETIADEDIETVEQTDELEGAEAEAKIESEAETEVEAETEAETEAEAEAEAENQTDESIPEEEEPANTVFQGEVTEAAEAAPKKKLPIFRIILIVALVFVGLFGQGQILARFLCFFAAFGMGYLIYKESKGTNNTDKK